MWLVAVMALLPLSSLWANPQTQDLKGEVLDPQDKPIAGARCTLAGRSLPERGLSVETGEQGQFSFRGLLPGAYDLTCAAVEHEPVLQKALAVTETGAPFVQVVLPPRVIVREKVEVHAQGETVSTQSSAPVATLSAQQLQTLPLTEQKFLAALPLVPGVVRTPDGKINIKGTVENQGMLLVDYAETVDPVTGSFSIDVPLDAVASLEVLKTAYPAEYGRFSGGLTMVQSKPPSQKWGFELNDFVPTIRVKNGHIVGIADDVPRLSFTGPILKNKLSFSESFTYTLVKQPVRGLPWPRNETKSEGFTSFTNFQYVVSPSHLLTANVNVFPLRRQFADINSLLPQSASSDYGQRGYSIGLTDRYMFSSGGLLTTLAKYTEFDSNARGQGAELMTISPEGRGGNFFNAWDRRSHQEELLISYQLPRKNWRGQHDLKVGTNFVYRTYGGSSQSSSVLLLRQDQSVASRIDFSGLASLEAHDAEAAAYVQDHWAFSDRLAVDVGIRYSGQTVGEAKAVAPRFGLLFSPDKSGKTIIRGGVGIFYDRVPLLAGDFPQNPVRTVSLFDTSGTPLGLPITYRNAYERIDEQRHIIVPSPNHLASTPYNVTWNFEVARELRPHVVARLSYLSSRTYDIFVINPLVNSPSDAVLLLTNTGQSRYHELEATVRVHPSENADMNFSYVYSKARGDLNTLTSVYVPFEQPVIQPNFYANLPSNVPHRVVSWGRFRIPWQVTISPVVDVHQGFPYSSIDVLQNYVGNPNTRRFPTFFSLDVKLTKDFGISFLPWLKRHKFRGALQIFNLTNHANFRDVFNNVASPYFGNFAGNQHRFYNLSLDIVY
jgi:hypothetical protein